MGFHRRRKVQLNRNKLFLILSQFKTTTCCLYSGSKILPKGLKTHIWASRFSKFSGRACPRTPLEKRGLRPRVIASRSHHLSCSHFSLVTAPGPHSNPGSATAKNSHNWRWAYTFPCQKFALFVSPFTLPISPFTERSPLWRWKSQRVHTFHCQKNVSPSLFLLFQMARTARRVIEKNLAIGRKAPHVSSAIFQNGDHVTMVPQPLAWSLGRHRDRNAALRVASTRRSRWTSTRTRWGRRARHTWRRT